jgi:beta-lactamase superfamily II metal-dependent hydrolase
MLRSFPVVSFLLLVLFGRDSATSPLRLSLYDVGEGDASLIEFADGKSILVESRNPSVGGLLASKIADKTGPMEAVMTHPPIDHFWGILPLLKLRKFSPILRTDVSGDVIVKVREEDSYSITTERNL